MTENTKISMIAINKWFYYAMNFGSKEMPVATFDGEKMMYLPDCFEAFPKHLRLHLKGKWDYAYEKYGSRTVLMAFYAELDGTNRKLLMEWVLNNYNDEQKLYFKEED